MIIVSIILSALGVIKIFKKVKYNYEKLILISHGSFCEGIKNSVEMIFGAQDYIYTVALTPEQGQETFEKL